MPVTQIDPPPVFHWSPFGHVSLPGSPGAGTVNVFHSCLPVSTSIGGDEAADAELAARRADHHLAVGDERRQRHVVAVLVVLDLRRPHLLAGLRVERDEHRVGGGEEHLVAVQRDAAAGPVQHDDVLGPAGCCVAPEKRAGFRVDRDHLVARRRDEHHAVVDDRRRLVAVRARRSRSPTPAAAGSTLAVVICFSGL